MRTLIVILSLISAVVLSTATAVACPEGYRPCGDFCCGGEPPPPVTP